MKITTKIITLFTVSLLFLSSVVTASASSFKNGAVRVVHASPDAPAVDILVNDQKTLSEVGFGQISEYRKVPRGDYNFKVTPANTTQPVVINADATIKQLSYYTVIAANYLSDIEPIVVEDSNRYIPFRLSQVQVTHLVPDAPAVDLTTTDGTILVSNLNFKDTQNIRLAAGTYDLELRVAGTDQVVYTLPNNTLERGTSYSAFALGTLTDADSAAFQVQLVKNFTNFDRLSFFR
jgi:hypothetical protein